MDRRSDQELFAAACAEDAGAFEVLYIRHRDWVAGLAWRVLGDRDAALDVLQDTFGYILRRMPGLRLEGGLRELLRPVVRHLCADSRHKRRPAHLPDDAEPAAPLGYPVADTDDLRTLLARLPDGQQGILLARFVDGLQLAEIGKALGIPLGTVKSRLHAALERLRHDPRVRRFFMS